MYYVAIQHNAILKLNDKHLKLVDEFIYLESNISSTESAVNLWIREKWTSIDKLSTKWKSNLFKKIKRKFFQAVAMSVLL